MILGALLTISVQSSSITTSTFTPLVGLDILTVEQMFPLTLGANIGTTCTAILASLVTDSRNAIQIALCHLLFNIIGISIWFPIKFLRRIPVTMAIKLGSYVSKFRWFGVFYILYTFVLFPLICWGLSYLFDFNIIGLISGIILIFLFIILSVNLFNNFDSLGNRIEKIMNIKKQNISSDIEMNIY
jgi:sodium-dependent phosphate cotransporter